MRLTAAFTLTALLGTSVLSGCLVVPEEPEVAMTEPVIVAPVIPLCYDVADLQRVETPAETKTVYAISVIENPPYEPIKQTVEQQIVTRQAEVSYVKVDPTTGQEVEVDNLCDSTIQTGPVGPGEGELSGPALPAG